MKSCGNQFGLKRLCQTDATHNAIKIVNEKWMKAIDENFIGLYMDEIL
jgi:hypothetical protein